MAYLRQLPIPATDFPYEIKIPRGVRGKCEVQLTGGGGGGGGSDGGRSGGAGSGGQFQSIVFDVVAGDVLKLVVGSPGTAGVGGRGNASGGKAGTSIISYAVDSSDPLFSKTTTPSNISFSGGNGGNAGTSGSSGGGGGGGGATILLKNDIIIAIAGGGGGGGGAGISSNGISAGNAVQVTSFLNGQNGQSKRGDGGGGGGSGGGYNAGAGGNEVAGDSGANPGRPADCFASIDPYSENSKILGSGVYPGNYGSTTYVAGTGLGGAPGNSGTKGFAVLYFDPSYGSYKYQKRWTDITDIKIKDSGSWNSIDSAYIKINGEWQSIYRREFVFRKVSTGLVGIDARSKGMIPPPPPPVYSESGGSNWTNTPSFEYSAVGDFSGTGYGTGNDSGTSFA